MIINIIKAALNSKYKINSISLVTDYLEQCVMYNLVNFTQGWRMIEIGGLQLIIVCYHCAMSNVHIPDQCYSYTYITIRGHGFGPGF